MKKARVPQNNKDAMRREYDFSQGVRGKHHQAYRAGTNVVFLNSDVAQAFADSGPVDSRKRTAE